jgi:DNA-binding protein YbaB
MDKNDLKKAMQTAQDLQIDLVKAQSELIHAEIKGQSKDGNVAVFMNAQGDFHSVKIKPELLAQGLPALEKGILQALKSAATQASNLTKERLEKIAKGIGL